MFNIKTHGHNIEDSNTYRIKMDVLLLNAALGISMYIHIYGLYNKKEQMGFD